MDYKEAEEYLESTMRYGSVLGLKTIKELLKRLGNPEKNLKTIHVAGTNGKGSVMAFLEEILKKAGYKVGCYNSPAVFSTWEIIRVNGSKITYEQTAKILTRIKKICSTMQEEGFNHPTRFEIETAMAFVCFCNEKCDIVLVECGMGGKDDATNVFDSVLCSVLTSIGLDHVGIIGNNEVEITENKCEIICENCPVVSSPQEENIRNIILKEAKAKNAPLFMPNKELLKIIKISPSGSEFEYKASNDKIYHISTKMLGMHQITNAITALESALVLSNEGYHLEKYIEEGISLAVWHGRMEIINDNPLTIIDGAHNPLAFKELLGSLDLYFTNSRITFIMGVLSDKDYESEILMLSKKAESIVTVTPNNKRGFDGRILKEKLRGAGCCAYSARNLDEAFLLAKNLVERGQSDMIVALGSLSYLGEFSKVAGNTGRQIPR